MSLNVRRRPVGATTRTGLLKFHAGSRGRLDLTCRVDGGNLPSSLCPKCIEADPDDAIDTLMKRLDTLKKSQPWERR